jgi:hypothetical protein
MTLYTNIHLLRSMTCGLPLKFKPHQPFQFAFKRIIFVKILNEVKLLSMLFKSVWSLSLYLKFLYDDDLCTIRLMRYIIKLVKLMINGFVTHSYWLQVIRLSACNPSCWTINNKCNVKVHNLPYNPDNDPLYWEGINHPLNHPIPSITECNMPIFT